MNNMDIETLRHSTSHVMAMAVKELFPMAKLGIGPAIEDGFYYDFELPKTLTPDDLLKIEEKMLEIIKKDIPFEKLEMKKDKASQELEKMNETLKIELLNEIPDEPVTFYKNDKFIDLCRGPHISSTGQIKLLNY
mgnify:CR=1 FL=1